MHLVKYHFIRVQKTLHQSKTFKNHLLICKITESKIVLTYQGCPVNYGNKWIANKWVKMLAQVKEYPCWRNTDYFVTAKQ